MLVSVLIQSAAWGGAEAHTAEIARWFLQRGHKVAVGCLGEACYRLFAERLPRGIDVRRLPRWQDVRTVGGWRRELRAFPRGGCLLSKGTVRQYSLAMEVAARMHFERLVTVEHLVPHLPAWSSRRILGVAPGLGLWWYRALWSGYCRSWAPHRVVCVSEAVARGLVEDYRFDRRKVVVLKNGVDAERFRPDAGSRREQRARWGIGERTVVFGGVGRLDRVKGFDVLVEAFGRYVERGGQEAALVIVGEGPERGALEALIRGKGLEGRVRLAGFMADTAAAYRAFDAFVLSSRSEAMPLTLLEAMASGCVPIGSRVGGIPEVIDREEVGFLVPVEDVEGLAGAMGRLAESGFSAMEQMRGLARERVVKHFDAEAQFAEIEKLLCPRRANGAKELAVRDEAQVEHVEVIGRS